jgi:hypothetical protein
LILLVLDSCSESPTSRSASPPGLVLPNPSPRVTVTTNSSSHNTPRFSNAVICPSWPTTKRLRVRRRRPRRGSCGRPSVRSTWPRRHRFSDRQSPVAGIRVPHAHLSSAWLFHPLQTLDLSIPSTHMPYPLYKYRLARVPQN